jgi:hypothetical protein
MKKTRFLLLVCPVTSLILELLPWGAVLNFGQPDGEPIRQTYSYFSLTPFGYANFGPLITAVLSCVLLVLSIAAAIRPVQRLWRANGNVAIVAALVSLSPRVMFGARYFTPIGGAITLLLVAHTVLMIVLLKRAEKSADTN